MNSHILIVWKLLSLFILDKIILSCTWTAVYWNFKLIDFFFYYEPTKSVESINICLDALLWDILLSFYGRQQTTEYRNHAWFFPEKAAGRRGQRVRVESRTQKQHKQVEHKAQERNPLIVFITPTTLYRFSITSWQEWDSSASVLDCPPVTVLLCCLRSRHY